MPTTTTTPATPITPAAATLQASLEARLAAREAQMTVLLDEAAVAHEVRTAHLPGGHLHLAHVITGPVAAPSPPPAAPCPTPVAAALQAAQQLLTTRGWTTRQFTGPDGTHCLRGALRAAAGGDRDLEERAEQVLLEAIRRHWHAVNVHTWNDAQHGPALPVRVLGEASRIADARGL